MKNVFKVCCSDLCIPLKAFFVVNFFIMKTIKIIWDTYIKRREIRALWAIYSYEEGWYIWNCKNIDIVKRKIEALWLECEEIENVEINEEYIIRQKNLRTEKKAERYSNLSGKRLQESNESSLTQQERDFLKLWEPVKVWHHSQRRHEKLLEKVDRDFEIRNELYNKSEEYQNKAEYWKNKKYYTEDQKKIRKENKKKQIDLALQLWKENHKVWDKFEWFWNADFTIKKINKKTVTVNTWSRWDISYSKDFDKYLKEAKEEIKNQSQKKDSN